MATIVLTGGGTAGHCTPHLSLLPYLKKDFKEIYYVGSENGIEKEIISKTDIPYYSVPCAKLYRSIRIDNIIMPFIVSAGIIKAGKILDKIKPDVVFSKGGYVSIPTVIAAKKRKIPVISHESDFTIGLANKITSKHCKKVLTSFKETAKLLKNGEYVGPPIRKSLFTVNKQDSLKYFGFSGKKPVLLVTGGSQGAKIINDTVRKCLPDLLTKYDIIHICGKNNTINEQRSKGYFQAEYINKMEYALNAASICISRAGSNTLFELLSLKIPCILIPLPKGNSRGDQVLNAEYFQKLGLVQVLPQDVLTPQSLMLTINSTCNNTDLIKNLNKHPITDSSKTISKLLASYIPL